MSISIYLFVMKFLVDGMLGSLCRWLRILGFEVKYLKMGSDNDLLEIAKKEKKILVTKDFELFNRAKSKGLNAVYLKGKRQSENLAEIAQKFNLNLIIDTSFSLCPLCDKPIKKIGKNQISGKVSLGTFKHHDEFWICSGCGKIYWKGNHWKKILEILNEAIIIKNTQGVEKS